MSGHRAKERRRVAGAFSARRPKHQLTAAALMTGALVPLAVTAAWPLPQGGTIAAGSATVSTPTTTSMRIDQATDRLIMDWTRFNIAANESVRFQQPSAASIALNRVSGQEPSAIFGSLSANGQIFLLNPSGILFGSSSRVDVGALTASTLAMTNQDFLAGHYRFTQDPGRGNAAVMNQGLITAGPGGYVALLGAAARNEGVIQAQLGSISLASGKAATLDMRGDGLIQFVITDAVSGAVNGLDGKSLASYVSNTGTLQADGGMVTLQAKTASDVIKSVVNQEGVVRATSLVNHGGVIRLIAGDDVANTGVIGWQANLGKVQNASGTVTNYGILDVSAGEAGAAQGQVTLAGEYVGHAGAIVARGADQATGGRVLLTSSKETVITKAGSIDTSGVGNSSAGNVVVWSDTDTIYQGHITAHGGTSGGDGGNVEVSGYQNLNFRGRVDLSALYGRTGSLLLDPTTITITGGSGDGAADGSNTFQGAATAGTISFADVSPTTVYESEIEGLNADIVLQAKQTITTSGTFGGAQVLLQNNRNLTLQTRNQVGDGAGGIDLTASADAANLEFKTQGTGSISITGSTDGGAAGNVTLGKLTTSGGAMNITANNGTITLKNNLTTAGGAIALLGATSLGADVTVDTTNAGGTATGANITISGRLDGAHTLTLAGGTDGAVAVQAASRSFDGVGNYILVNSTFSLGAGNATIGAWVYLDSASRNGSFVKIGTETDASGGDGYAIGVGGTTFDNTGNHLIVLYEGLRWINTNINIGTGWHHVAVTLNSSGYPTAYLDGTSVYSDSSGAPRAPGSIVGVNDTQIGGYTGSGSENRHAQALIADVQVYNRALLASEVIQIKAAPASVTSGLVGFWSLMGGSTETDRSGNGNTGTLVGSTMSSANPSTAILTTGYNIPLTSLTVTGNAIAINGVTSTGEQSYTGAGTVTLNGPLTTTSNGNVTVTAAGSITAADAISANGSGSVVLTATGGASNITTSGAIGSGSGLISLLADNNITLNSGGTVGAATTGGITIAADNDASGAGILTTSAAIGNSSVAGAITLSGYDIALGASVTGSGALTIKPSTAARNITIGADNPSDFALNPLEISYLTDGFSGITIGRAVDGTGVVTINPATFKDPLTIAGGSMAFARSSSRDFDGTGDYITLANESNFDFERTNVFSFGGWFKVTDFSDYRMLMSKMREGAPYTGWDAYVNQTTGLVTAQLINNYGPDSLSVTTTSAITAGTWNHIYVTYDGSSAAGGLKIYVNGTLQGQTIVTNTLTSSILNNEPVLIGQRNASANYDLLGQAAHVAVYASELNAAQVDQLRLYPTSITANLKAYLPLGVSGTETDFSTYANNGTPTNTTVIAANKAPVTILNTGTNTLTLTARTGSIQGSGAGTDINAGGLTAAAVTGIGSTTQLTTQTTSLSATTSGAGAAAINIANSSSSATTLGSLSTVGANAPITFVQSGGGALTVTSAATMDGAITLSNVAADLTVTGLSASGSNSAISLTTTTSGNISLGSETGAIQSLTVTSPGTASLPAVTTRDGGISVAANAITLNGDLSTNAIATAGPVTLTGAITLGTDVAMTTDAATTDANITLSGQIDGAHALTLNAGSGNIMVQAASRSFNGVNGYVSVTDAPVLSSSNVKSVSLWFKRNSLGTFIPRLINEQSDANNAWLITVPETGQGDENAAVVTVVVGGARVDVKTPNNTLNLTNTWYHLVAEWNGASVTAIYINGVSQPLQAATSLYLTGGTTRLTIGNRSDGLRTFDGQIADVQLYNRILSSTEVSQIKAAPQAVTNGLVGFWPLMGGTTEADRSGQGNTGTLFGPTISTASPMTSLVTVGGLTALRGMNVTGNTINIQGVTTTGAQSYTGSGGVTLNGALTTTANGNVTVTAASSITANSGILANGSGTVTLTANGGGSDITTGGAIDSGSGLIRLQADNNITLNTGGTVGANTTGAITIAADADESGAGTLTTGAAIGNASAAGAITLSGYDMVLGASVTGSGALTLKPSTAARNITIGADNLSDFALNSHEISLLTDGFSSITIGRTGDGTGTVTVYPSTFKDPLTIAGGSLAFGRQSSRSFDGVGDYISAPTTKTATATFSMWASSIGMPGARMLFISGPDGVGPDLFFYNGKISWNTWNSDANSFGAIPANAGDGNFHHYVVVVEPGNTKLYYDGALLGTAAYADPSGTTRFDIGGTSSYFWNGKISDVQIFNRALTVPEIAQIAIAPGAVTSGLAFYSPLGGASPESDYSGNGNVGTLVGTSISASAPPVTILYAGANPVTLMARTGSIQGSGAGTDIVAATLTATAVTGIGNTTQLATSGLTSGSASTSGAGAAAINIANSSASATTLSSLATIGANAPITFAQSGGGALIATSATTTDGAVTLSTASAALTATTVTAGGSSRNITLTTTTSGTLSAGTLTATGDTITLIGAGAIVDTGAIAAGLITGQAATNITLNGTVSATSGGDSLVLVAGGNFINNTGASALAPGAGRWLVYSTDPAADTRGGLVYNFKQYNATYGVTTVLGTGNGFLYTLAPSITPSLIGTVTKGYDGTNAATLAVGNYVASGAIDGDTVTLNNPASGSYDTKSVGINKNVSVSGLSIASATDGAATVYGYQLASTTANANIGTITAKALTITAQTNSKGYDSTTSAAAIPVVVGLVGSDTVTGKAETYATANAGVGKTLAVSAYTVNDGNSGNNYTVSTVADATGVISKAGLTVTGVLANNKAYDGTTVAALTTGAASVTALGADMVTLSSVGATGAFVDPNVGVAKPVTVMGFTIGGVDAGNYMLTQPSGLTADITGVTLVVNGGIITGLPGNVQYLLSGPQKGDAQLLTAGMLPDHIYSCLNQKLEAVTCAAKAVWKEDEGTDTGLQGQDAPHDDPRTVRAPVQRTSDPATKRKAPLNYNSREYGSLATPGIKGSAR